MYLSCWEYFRGLKPTQFLILYLLRRFVKRLVTFAYLLRPSLPVSKGPALEETFPFQVDSEEKRFFVCSYWSPFRRSLL